MPSSRFLRPALVLLAHDAISSAEVTLTKVSLEHVDPLAVCGDGSPAAYYFRPALLEGASSSMWIVDLEGGGWCYDESSCASRCPRGSTHPLCSSKTYADSKSYSSGLFHPKLDPALDQAAKVWIPYCTSDGHMGDTETFGRQFRGSRVIQAVFKDLTTRHGLGSTRQELIFGGQSAGGRGAMVHLDYVADMMGPTAAANVKVVGLPDSPLWIDMAPYPKGGFVGFANMCKGVFKNFNVTHLGKECHAAHPGADAWKCTMGQYRMPHVKTPYLVVASQYDAFQLGENKIYPGVASADAKAYAADFAKRTANVMRTLRANWPKSAPMQNAVLSWACYDHASSMSGRGFDEQTCGADQVTLGMALKQFLGLTDPKPSSPKFEWIDSCQGFACGKGCKLSDGARTIVV